jgi:uroporphyrinogen-III decarboxylase
MPHFKDAEMNVGIGNEFMQAGKDCLSIHDSWGVRLEDLDFLDEASARQFIATHEEPMLNSMGYDVPKRLPSLGDSFQITR